MLTAERCIGHAQEAERLAALVSYERDRVRLTRQAHEWRAKAAELERAGPPPPEPPPPTLAARVWRALARRRAGGG